MYELSNALVILYIVDVFRPENSRNEFMAYHGSWIKMCIICDNFDNIGKLSELLSIDCSGCTKLTHIPNGLTQLEKLRCSSCTNLTHIPNDLKKLTYLNCALTGVIHIPSESTNLTRINCSGCTGLTCIPSELVNLDGLFCQRCTSLTDIPSKLINLSHLECPDCTGLTHIPDELRESYIYCPGCTSIIFAPQRCIDQIGPSLVENNRKQMCMERLDSYREELIRTACRPDRVLQWTDDLEFYEQLY
jgi:LSD1 subclass zinc finger protein